MIYRYIDQLIYRWVYIDMSDISREIYRYIWYIGRNISADYFFLNKHLSSPKHFLINDNFLDSSSKMTRIITYFQISKHEKLITTFFTWYFPSPSICHENLRFRWKLLQTIIYSLKLEKLIITFFREKKWKHVNLLQPIYIEKYIDIHGYIVHLYIDINISIYRYFQYTAISLPSL